MKTSNSWVLVQVGKVAWVSLINHYPFHGAGDHWLRVLHGDLHLLESLFFQDLLNRFLRVDTSKLRVVLEHLSSNFGGHTILSLLVANLRGS